MGGRPTGLWLAELAEPYYVFTEAGFDVTIASVDGGSIPIDAGSMAEGFFTEDSKKFLHDAAGYAKLSHSVKLSDLKVDDFDALFIAGGHGTCVDGAKMKEAVEAFYASGKPLCADCHGPYALITCTKPNGEALVKGLEVTGFTNLEEEQAGAKEWVEGNALFIETEFKKQGAKFISGDPWTSKIAVAGNLITAQNPQSTKEGALKVAEMLA
jgi:putative intracellular protease/amidase